MAENESATLAALKAVRQELIDPTIHAHDGRVFKAMGDGVLAEFSSVVARSNAPRRSSAAWLIATRVWSPRQDSSGESASTWVMS